MTGASTEAQDLILDEIQDGVAILTLNNPRRRNAVSSQLLARLKEKLDAVAVNEEVRVVIIRAEGPVYSSGHDLKELLEGDEANNAHVFGMATIVMEAIRLLPQPVIAEVGGLATAAGCQLVASCDMAVASEEARFATPGVRNGLFCITPGVALARAVPQKKAMEMLLTGLPISADEALQFGLVSRVVPADELHEQTMELARHISAASSYTLAIGKRSFYAQIGLDYGPAYEVAEKLMTDNMQAHDAHEGIDAFLTKRSPEWKNR
jgi:enoyl-CoA hydratase/carnithine racemase